MKPMTPRDILRALKTLDQEQSELFIQLQLDMAKLDGQIQGVEDTQNRFKEIYEPDK